MTLALPNHAREGEAKIKPVWRVTLALLCVVLLAGGTVFILFSRRHLAGSDDAELAGWCVAVGLGLTCAAAFAAESIIFPKSASASPAARELRFVVLRHDGIDEPHFDLMLETTQGSELATWRSPIWPIAEPTTLLQLANHRRHYLEYEGEVSGGRGSVHRVAAGLYRISDEIDGGKRIEWIAGANLAAKGSEPLSVKSAATPTILRRISGNEWVASQESGS